MKHIETAVQARFTKRERELMKQSQDRKNKSVPQGAIKSTGKKIKLQPAKKLTAKDIAVKIANYNRALRDQGEIGDIEEMLGEYDREIRANGLTRAAVHKAYLKVAKITRGYPA